MAWIDLAKECVRHPRKSKVVNESESLACDTLSRVLKVIEVRKDEGIEGLSLYVTKYREYEAPATICPGGLQRIFTSTQTTGLKDTDFVDLGQAASAPDVEKFFSSLVLSRMEVWFSKGVDPCAPQWAASQKAGVSQPVIMLRVAS